MRRRPLCLLCLLVIGVLYGIQLLGLPLRREPSDIRAVDNLIETPFTLDVKGEVVRCEAREDYTVLLLDHSYLFHNSRQLELGKVRVSLRGTAGYPAGTLLCVQGILEKPEGPSNPGQFDQAAWYALQDIRYIMKNPQVRVLKKGRNPFGTFCDGCRRILTDRVQTVYPEDVSGVLGAMLSGDKTLVDPDEKSLYRMGGASHVLAISGLHVTLLGMGLFRILRLVRVPLPPAAGISAASLVLYAFVTGLGVSTVRATIMFTLIMLAKVTGRTYDMPTGLALACLLIVIENPLWLTNAGFLLSFTAVTALCIFHDRSPFAGGVIMYVCMLPVILSFFYEIPLYGVLVNLVVVPLMPFVMGFGILGTALGRPFHWPAVWLLRFLHFLLEETAHLPAASLIAGRPSLWQIGGYAVLAFIFLGGITAFRTSRKRFLFYAMLPFMVSVFLIRPREGLKVTFLDVGQGDGCVLELPGGATVLVDSGSSTAREVGSWRTLPFLKYEGIRRLDYIVVTHMDSDHSGGIREILLAIRDRRTSLRGGTVVLPYLEHPSEAWTSMAALAEEAGVRVLAVQAGDVFFFGKGENETTLTVLGPDPAVEGDPPDENAQSVVLGLHYGNFDCLLTGDVQGAGEEQLMERLKKAGETYDVLKVAHHGSRNSTPAAFLRQCRPTVSVISSGKNNLYGHPSEELLERLRDAGAVICRTDRQGAVTIETDGDVYTVQTFLGDGAPGAP